MASRKINIFLSSFDGLGLPRTFNLVLPVDLSLADLRHRILDILPPLDTRLIITTSSNKTTLVSEAPLSSLLSTDHENLLRLRLSVPLCGGKGGFGSQLRAAGGRMASKRKKNQGENNNSNRNLDGRRLRTVNEAKALAEYLALKPGMEGKEKEARRKRWEQVVDLAEKREEELRSATKGKVDGKWVEDKEEASERTREAVLGVMQMGGYRDNLTELPMKETVKAIQRTAQSSIKDERLTIGSSPVSSALKPSTTPVKSYVGFDEDEAFMSDSEEENVNHEGEVTGKGKDRDNT
ncbi:MAG: hypothetical protein Q9164_000087 [Protoblastenia rupestris]